MKHLHLSAILVLAGIAIGTSGFAQVPPAFSYQAIARDGSGSVLANKNVSFRLSIQQGTVTGAIVYSERHYTTTNEFGLVNLQVGKGTADTGTLDGISWGVDQHFLKVEIDPNGGNNFQLMGSSQLLSVPYALHAKTVQRGDDWGLQSAFTDVTLSGNGTMISPLGIAQRGALTGQVLKWSGLSWVPMPDDTGPTYWTQDGDNLYYLTGKVGIGRNPAGDNIQFESWSLDRPAIGATNTSATWPTLSVENTGGGPAAEFRSPIKISDGSQGTGKVLTSNASGLATWQSPALQPWQINGGNLYYLSGNIGIGTTTPDQQLTLFGRSFSQMHFITALSGSTSTNGLLLGFKDDGAWMWNNENTELYFGTNNMKRMTIGADGTVSIMENLYLNPGKKIGLGVENPANSLEILGGITAYQKFYTGTSGTTSSDGLLVGASQVGNRAYFWNYEDGPIYFGTTGGLVMSILANGNIGIGNSAPAYQLDISGNANLNKGVVSGQALLVNGDEALWYNGTYFSWGYGGTYNYFADKVSIGTPAVPGYDLVVNGTAAKTGGGSWSNLSDSRLKDIRGDYTRGLGEIVALQPVRYTYKKDNPRHLDSNTEEIGFIAQEVEKVFPEAVRTGADGYKDFNMHPVNVALVNAVRELKAENDRLRAQNENLNNRLTSIENYLRAEARK